MRRKVKLFLWWWDLKVAKGEKLTISSIDELECSDVDETDWFQFLNSLILVQKNCSFIFKIFEGLYYILMEEKDIK